MSRKTLIISILSASIILLVLLGAILWISEFGQDSRKYGVRHAYRLRSLDDNYSEKEMGCIVNHEEDATTFRLFAPSASRVKLYIFEKPVELDMLSDAEPLKVVRMRRDRDGVWEYSAEGVLIGAHYCYRVERHDAARYVADPYALSVTSRNGTAIIVDPKSINNWFDGWEEETFTRPAFKDLIIYEVDIRNFTMYPSSGVGPNRRGSFAGFSDTRQTETGLYHLSRLGVNAVSLIGNAQTAPGSEGQWVGYNALHPFSLSSAHAVDPDSGSQYYEFKQVVSDLHAEDIAVIVDLELPFATHPQLLAEIDAAYYLKPLESDANQAQYTIRLEAPMYRQMISDMLAQWIEQYRVDGFRLLNVAQYDADFLRSLHEEATALDPSIIFVADIDESDQELGAELRAAGWLTITQGRHDDVLSFFRGSGQRDDLVELFKDFHSSDNSDAVAGRILSFSSRDAMTVADKLTSDKAHDGRNMTPSDLRRNLAATVMLGFYPGPVLIAEGQDFLHSRRGRSETRSMGNEVNALRWNARNASQARSSIAYFQALISLRNSVSGSSIKSIAAHPAQQIDWILPDEDGVMGFMLNRQGELQGGRFIVVFNASESPRYVELDFPPGLWRIIARGTTINPAGVPGSHRVRGGSGRAELVSPGSFAVFMSE